MVAESHMCNYVLDTILTRNYPRDFGSGWTTPLPALRIATGSSFDLRNVSTSRWTPFFLQENNYPSQTDKPARTVGSRERMIEVDAVMSSADHFWI